MENARALARFSNLEKDAPTTDPEHGVEYFHKSFYPGFVPNYFWTMSAPLTKEVFWQAQQLSLRAAWKTRFPLDTCIRLINAGTLPDSEWRGAPDASPDRLAPNALIVPQEQAGVYHINLENDVWLTGSQVWPYQQAVMFLCVNPWRARFCVCGNRFVADIPARRFCSDKCFQDSRKLAKQAWWSAHGEGWRSSKEAKNKSSKAKAKRSAGKKSS